MDKKNNIKTKPKNNNIISKLKNLFENPIIRYSTVTLCLFCVHTVTALYNVLLKKYSKTKPVDIVLITACRNTFGVIATPVIAYFFEGKFKLKHISK